MCKAGRGKGKSVDECDGRGAAADVLSTAHRLSTFAKGRGKPERLPVPSLHMNERLNERLNRRLRRARATAWWSAGFLVVCLPAMAPGQRGGFKPGIDGDIDPGLARVIAAVPAIDNHAHPVLPPPGATTDRGFDALPVDTMEPSTDTAAWRPDNPELPAAWAALWGVHATAPLTPEKTAELERARAAVKAREGAHYATWVESQAGVATTLANRVEMGTPGQGALEPPGFRWVPYADALLFPLDNAALADANPDRKLFFPLEDRLRARYLLAAGLKQPPSTLAEYLQKVVTPTLERQKAGGAVAEKFEIAYLRAFGFSDPPEAEAARVYAKWAGKPGPDAADYRLLQDFLFRYIARECGRLRLAVHLHTMAGGGGYFSVAGDDPLLLEPLFNDPRLRGTRFVLLHGGWPFVREAGALLQKPNVYLDLSQETLQFAPRTLSGWLREWLETYPDKVLFGTDAYPYSDAMGWEESDWMAARNGRAALGLALTGMMRDGEISRERAEAIAREVLRGTAATLYGLP